jgi:hypothetical protein
MARHRVPSGTRNKRATWRSVDTHCRERDWSEPRLLYELQNGWPYQTWPPGQTIDWYHPEVKFDLAASKVTYRSVVTLPPGVIRVRVPNAGVQSDDIIPKLCTVGLDLWALPDAPADAEAPLPSVDAPATVPAPLRKPLTNKEVGNCILAIKEERPDDPPDRDELRDEVENRLNWPVGRDRVEKIRKKVAPQWVNPKGRPRKSAQ